MRSTHGALSHSELLRHRSGGPVQRAPVNRCGGNTTDRSPERQFLAHDPEIGTRHPDRVSCVSYATFEPCIRCDAYDIRSILGISADTFIRVFARRLLSDPPLLSYLCRTFIPTATFIPAAIHTRRLSYPPLLSYF